MSIAIIEKLDAIEAAQAAKIAEVTTAAQKSLPLWKPRFLPCKFPHSFVLSPSLCAKM